MSEASTMQAGAGADARGGAEGGALRYVRDTAFEFVLAAVCSACLAMTVGDGFNIAYETLFDIPVVAAAVVPLLAACYFGQYRRRNVWIAVVAVVALMGAVVWVGTLSSTVGQFRTYEYLGAGSVLDDSQGNNTVYGYVLAIVPVLVFLLTRKRALAVVLLAAGSFACAMVQWLFVEWLWVPFIGFLLSGIALFVERTYRLGRANAASVGTVRGWQLACATLAVPAVLVAAAFSAWFGLIAPLAPPAAELKLVQLHYNPDIEELTRYEEEKASWVNPDEFSDTVDGAFTLYTDNPDNPGGKPERVDESSDQTVQAGGSAGVSYVLEGIVPTFDFVGGETLWWLPAVLAAVLVALVAGAVALRRHLRTRWYRSLEGHAPAWRVCALYDRITRSLARMRLAKPASATQVEFAASTAPAMAAFEQDAQGASYLGLSKVYERVYFGHEQPGEDDVAAFEAFWKVFFRNARRYSGPLRYLWRFWRI